MSASLARPVATYLSLSCSVEALIINAISDPPATVVIVADTLGERDVELRCAWRGAVATMWWTPGFIGTAAPKSVAPRTDPSRMAIEPGTGGVVGVPDQCRQVVPSAPMARAWTLNPHAGGVPVPDNIKEQTKRRLLAHAEKHYAGRYARLDVRFKGATIERRLRTRRRSRRHVDRESGARPSTRRRGKRRCPSRRSATEPRCCRCPPDPTTRRRMRDKRGRCLEWTRPRARLGGPPRWWLLARTSCSPLPSPTVHALLRRECRSSFSSCWACHRSTAICELSQNSGVVFSTLARRSAVLAVRERRPLTIPLTSWMSTPIFLASASCVSFMGLSHSSSRISPGGVGVRWVGSLMASSAVVVGDRHVAGLAPVEVEDDAELVVDADAVLAGERALELLQVVAGRGEVAQVGGVVERRELPRGDAPEVLRNPSCCLGAPAVEDVLGASVREARDHCRKLALEHLMFKSARALDATAATIHGLTSPSSS